MIRAKWIGVITRLRGKGPLTRIFAKQTQTIQIPGPPIQMVQIISLVTKENTENDIVKQCEKQVNRQLLSYRKIC